jgi:hypothetical protein
MKMAVFVVEAISCVQDDGQEFAVLLAVICVSAVLLSLTPAVSTLIPATQGRLAKYGKRGIFLFHS